MRVSESEGPLRCDGCGHGSFSVAMSGDEQLCGPCAGKEIKDLRQLLEDEYESKHRIEKEELICNDPECWRTKTNGGPDGHWWDDFCCSRGRRGLLKEIEKLKEGK